MPTSAIGSRKGTVEAVKVAVRKNLVLAKVAVRKNLVLAILADSPTELSGRIPPKN